MTSRTKHMKAKTYVSAMLICIFTVYAHANSRVAFSRPGSILRTPGSSHFDETTKNPLFTVGFSSEVVNFNLPSASTSLYLQSKTKAGLHLGFSYTTLADPRSKDQIEIDSEKTYVAPTEMGLHIQQRIYSAGNINIDLGINDILSRNYNGSNEFQTPSIFAVFSSKKEFEKYTIVFNYGFGSGKVGTDSHLSLESFSKKDGSVLSPYLGLNILTPENKRLKNRIHLLFEYDGSGINVGSKVPITDEYAFSIGVINLSDFGDFGLRSKVGYEEALIYDQAPTISMGFEMNIPRKFKKSVTIDKPYTSLAATTARKNASAEDQQVLYTAEAVQQLSDSLNALISTTREAYGAIADSIRFLTFSLENSIIENTSLSQKIAILDDSLAQNRNQQSIDNINFNKASRHISRSLRYYYEGDYNKALVAIDKAIELNPNLAIAYARKGTIYFRIGQIKNASVNWNIALKLDPEYDEVRDILEALKTNNLKSVDVEVKE